MTNHRQHVIAAISMAFTGILIAVSGQPGATAGVEYGVTSSMEQLRPNAVADGRPTSASITAIRNETESFQLVIEGPLTNVNVSGDLFGWGTTTIYRLADYTVTEPSDREGATGVWRDALVPEVDLMYGENRNAFPANVNGGTNLAVWVDVHVPPATPGGTYHSNLQITANEGTATVPVTIEVIALDVPSTSTLRSAFYMVYDGAIDPVCLAHTGSANCNGNSVLRNEMYALYSRIALENRITLANGSGLRHDQSPSMYAGGTWETSYEAPVIAGTVKFPATAAYRLDGARPSSVGVFSYADFHCLAACVSNWKLEAEEPVVPFADRFTLYGCDEPNDNPVLWQNCATNLSAARSAWPAAPAIVTATIGQYNTYAPVAGLPAAQILVPPINRIHDRPGAPLAGNQRSTYNTFLATPGNELWLYASCLSNGCGGDTFGSPGGYWDGWPGYAIDAPAVQQRAMAWMAWRYDADGELYWAADRRLSTAWTAGGQFESGANGDGTLFYPGTPALIGGTHHIPVESIRLKRIRDGYEDYELMTLLATAGQGAAVDQIVSQRFPTAYSASAALDGTGPGTLLSSRDELLAIAREIAPPPSDPEPAGPSQIAYADNTDGDYEIFRIPSAGGTPVQLTNNTVADRFPAWSPDGTKLAWTSGPDVWVMNSDGTNQVNLTSDVAGASEKPAWSPDGQVIAFVTAAGDFTDIWKMNADGAGKSPLVTYASGSISSYDPAIDSTNRVVFNLGEDLYQINLDGTGFGPVVAGATVDEVVDIGPVTDRLTFSRSTGGQPYDVMTSSPTGETVVNVTNRPGGNDFQSTWSPDETRLAYSSNQAGTLDIWLIDADGSNAVALTSGAGSELDADWGPGRSRPAPNDFDGDGASDRGVYRPAYGGWYLLGQPTVFHGLSNDLPVPGDYDGDGTTERAVYRSGAWYIEGQPAAFLGTATDSPVPGDYNGDGVWEPGIYRPSVGGWYIDGSAAVFHGLDGDVPVPGDYNGDGTFEPAVYRPQYGAWYVTAQPTEYYGLATDTPLGLPQAIYRTYF